MDPDDRTTYDDYLGRFVDAVQQDAAQFASLLERWAADCPADWRERFDRDGAEIASLLEAGAFGRGEEDAA